jgi:hypothetical protein
VNGRPWTSSEIDKLRANAHHGRQVVAALLGRSELAVATAARRFGISLRRPGSRAGRRQTRHIDPRALDALTATRTRPLCPACAARPIDVPVVGLCQVCYRRGLAQAHREEAAITAAGKDLDAARQEKHRSRERAE